MRLDVLGLVLWSHQAWTRWLFESMGKELGVVRRGNPRPTGKGKKRRKK